MSWNEIPEAPLRQGNDGVGADGEGWFVVNVADAEAWHTNRYGKSCPFERRSVRMFPEFGINVRVLEPGEPSAMYHRETCQEAFLVLDGECVAIVEGQERPMRKGDFLHTPAGTAHILVGAGDGPCAVVMVGTRKDDKDVVYPVSEAAARYGAAVPEETADRGAAYAGVEVELKPLGRVPW